MTKQEKRIEEMIYKVYLDNESGGALHIVIGDGNFEDNHIKYCLECSIQNIENDEKRSLYEECAKGLLSLKLSRRYSLAGSAWDIYCKADEVRKEMSKEIYKTVERLMTNNFSNEAILYTMKQKYLNGNNAVTNNDYIEGKKDGVKQALTELVKLARWEDGMNTVSIRQIKEKAKEFGVEVVE